jgi:hypothetical protein
MSWTLSCFRAGDLVEVRSREDILAPLDQDACVDGMPFMPEMLQFSGQRFRVGAVAHKTCDPIHKPGGRRLRSTVHLAGLRCDGSAHEGCQAACNLFWKDVWLKPVGDNATSSARPPTKEPRAASGGHRDPAACQHASAFWCGRGRIALLLPGHEALRRDRAIVLVGLAPVRA